ncbi:1697_t:CDS:10, partial [Acaulospora colombiana]
MQPNEAKKWITALTHSTMQFDKNEKISRTSTADDLGNDESPRPGRSKHKPEAHNNNSVNTQTSESTQDTSDRDRSRSSSDESIEVNGTPHEDNYQMAISNARVQLGLQKQLLGSLLSMVPNPPLPNSKESATVELFNKSLTVLQSLVDDVLRMSEERDTYWQEKLEKELKTKRLWEDSMRELVIEQTEMEEEIQYNVMEQKIRKKQLKAAIAEGQIPPSSPLLNTLSETFDRLSNKSDEFSSAISHSRSATDLSNRRLSLERSNTLISTLADEYDSDDEFYDAIDEGSTLEESIQSDVRTKLDETGGIGVMMPYIASSYHGYPENTRNLLPLDQKSSRPDLSLWSILKNSIGKDLSRITIPVYFNEPTSMLQRLAEDMEYSELLDIAARQKCSTERILYVAAFAMSNYSSTVGRIAKPFNPLLGETYEYVRPDKAFRYVSEQVSHHPPISACYCESPNYDFFSEIDMKSKFWGKSFEILPQGVSHVNLKVPQDHWPRHVEGSPEEFAARGNPNAFAEHYSWKKVTTCVNNLIVGSPWIDHYGDMVILNHLTGDKCVLTFKARGWRGKDAFEIRGYIKDHNDKEIWEIAGRWNERLVARRSNANLLSIQEDDLGSDRAALNATSTSENGVLPSPSPLSSTQTNRRPIYLLWKRNPLPEEPLLFNLTPFAVTLNDLPDSLANWIAPTDSRLRPDQRALENGLYDLANSEKMRLEEKQREKRKNRDQDLRRNHAARWFRRAIEPDTGENYWEFNHEYWEERERVGKEKMEALDENDIALLKTYGQGPYAKELKKIDNDIKDIQKRINEKIGVKESDTGLAPPNLWDIPADRQRMQEEQPLQVARCTKIIQAGENDDSKYIINVKQIAKFVVALGDRVSPTDIEEGMRVGVDRNKYQIQIPLPPKIDPSVTMMQVEEKPDVTYSDVGGCKEQIEKLREVVELPLLQPERFVSLGIDPPKGVLLYGPPGTGKTLCARAVANRTDATFIRVIGSELVQNPDTLDPALLRPGRLDRKVEFSLPDLEGRAHILKIHAKSMSVERDIRYELIARLCPNSTGAELRSVCTEAGMFAIRSRRKVATEKDFLEAVNKVIK